MSEILSQEQIDNLLGQKDMFGTGASTTNDSAGASDVKNYGALGKVFEIFNEQASTVISTILNKHVSCETISCAQTDVGAAPGAIETPALSLTIPFKNGLKGSLVCVLAKKDVAYLSDLMMMGDGTAAYCDDHKDAIVELMGQVMGSFTTALGGKLGESVGVDQLAATEFDFAAPPFPLDATDMATIKASLERGRECKVHFFIPAAMSLELMGKMAKASRPEETGAEMGDANILGAPGMSDISSMGQGRNADSGDSFVETSLSGHSLRTGAGHENIDMLLDVDLDVYIELGRTNLSIKRVLDLSPGSIVELDRMAGEPVDLLVNDKVVAKGEVVVVDENFGIRIVSLVSAEDRIKSLK